MSTELRTQIAKILSDIPGDLEPEDEDTIVNKAYKKLSTSKKEINEGRIIDAILASFQDENDELFLMEQEQEDDLFDLLRVSSYDEDDIYEALYGFEREASVSDYDMHRGSEDAEYDEKGKDYRPPVKNKKKLSEMEEFEIKDGPHDKITYHNEATKTENIKRTRSDMLVRS